MVDLNRAYQEQLQKGLGTYTGPKTKGQAIGEGIAGLSMGADDFVLSLPEKITGGVQRMGESVLDYFNSPTAAFAEQTGKEQNLADARREASLTMPSDGLGRPREIQEQIDIFQALNPDAGSVTTEQINKLSEGKNLKPFPAQPKKQGLKPFPKEQAEQNVADANREASLDMPSMSDDPAEQLFAQAMTDYISKAREGAEGQLPKVGDIEAYKKKFAEATGVDISGKPDTSQALMAMGLSMMQNRAGKGFNVGRMLSSVGEAGEKALPALTAAKAEARNNVIAAGKYALTAQDADEKTRKAAEKDLMNRGNYWIYKKGGEEGEFLRDKNGIMPFDEGSFEYLNKSEMNKLINDPEFNKQFSFIDADKRFEILKSRAESLGDKDDQWMEYDNRSMIGGELKDTPRDLIAFAAAKNSNVSGQKTNFKMGETAQTVVDRFQGLQKTINRGGEQFETLINAIDTGISIPKQIASTVVTLGRNLGLDLGDGPTDIKTAQTMLKQIAVREATNILQESGKTLSDNDRKRVEELVGEIDFSSGDKALVKKKLKEIHYLTVIKPQQNLDKAVGWLEREAGITFGAKGSPEGIGEPPTKSELAKMNVRRKEAGQPPYTMDMFE